MNNRNLHRNSDSSENEDNEESNEPSPRNKNNRNNMKGSTSEAAPSFQSYITNEGKSIYNNTNDGNNYTNTINENSITNDYNNNINSINNEFNNISNENNNNNENNNISNENSNENSNNNSNINNNRKRDISIFDEEESSEEEEFLPINNNNNNNNNSESNNQIKLYENQKQIYLKAKEKPNNSIIFMETGKGKTLISILLMADLLNINIFSQKNQKIDKTKKIIFFVCDTSLIIQQQKAIEKYLKISVGVIQGKKSKKSKSDYENFRGIFENFSVFVAIHNVIYKLLSCGFLEISEIDMFVFDECHHCNFDHPYNLIMEEFYFYYKNNFPEKKLPVIIGLTASPSKNAIKNNLKQTAKNSLQILSENLDCKVIIDPEMRNNFVDVENFNDLENIFYVLVEPHVIDENYNEIKELLKKNFFEKFTNLCFDFFFADEIKKISDDFKLKIEKKNEYVKIYNKLIDEKFNSLNLLLFNQIDEFKINNFSLIFKVYEKIQRNIFLILENLDVFSLQKYFNENVEVYYNLIHKKHNEKNYINEIEKFPVSILKKILEIFENFKNSLEIKLKSSENYQSDRIKKMKNELSNQLKNNPKSKIVIFVQNRIVAYYLEEILNNYFKSQNISCVSVIGINRKRSESGTVLNPNNTLNELNSKIKKFNSNESQILIGTSAIEEGLDFQTCNSVLVFTQLNTAKSYIQMKGRARMKNHSFKVFTNEIESTKNNIKSFVLLIQEMKEFFKYDFVYDFRRKGFENNKSIGKYFFKFKNSQAKITLKNVSMLFHEVLQQANNLNCPIKVKIETKKIKNPNLNPEFFFVSEGIFDDDNKINFKLLKKNVVDGKIKGNSHKEKNNSEKEIQMRILVILYKLGYLSDYVKFQIPK